MEHEHEHEQFKGWISWRTTTTPVPLAFLTTEEKGEVGSQIPYTPSDGWP